MKVGSFRQRILVVLIYHVILYTTCGSDYLSNNVKNSQSIVEDKDITDALNKEHLTSKKAIINIAEPVYVSKFSFNTNGEDIYSTLAEDTLKNPVLIEQCRCSVEKCNKSFDVDKSVDTILVEVRSRDSPDCRIQDSDGNLVAVDGENVTIPVNNGKIKITSIKYPANGRWSLACSDSKDYNISIKGSSLIHFTPSFIDNNSIIMSGRPTTGSNTTLAIEMTGIDNLRNLTNIAFTTPHGDFISKYPLSAIGRDRRLYKCHVMIPSQDFMISIIGYDTAGFPFERMFRIPFKPARIKLVLEQETQVIGDRYQLQYRITNDGVKEGTYNISVTVEPKIFSYIIQPQSVFLRKGEDVTCNLTFTAKGKTGDTSLAVVNVIGPHGVSQYSNIQLFVGSDNSSSTTKKIEPQAPTTKHTDEFLRMTSSSKRSFNSTRATRFKSSIKLITGSSTSPKGSIKSTAGSNIAYKRSTTPMTRNVNTYRSTVGINNTDISSFGMVHSSTIALEPSTSMASSVQDSVTEQTTHEISDIKPPAFTKVDYIDNCRSDDVCDKHQWIVFFQVQDDESGVHRVDVDDKTLTSISIESFCDGLSKTPINGNVSINCCKKQVTIIVEDMEGNRGRFPVHYHHKNRNSTTIISSKDTNLSSIQIASIVVGSFAGCLVFVIVLTLTIQISSYRNKLHRKSSNKKLARIV